MIFSVANVNCKSLFCRWWGSEVGVDIVQVMICLGGVEGTPEEVEVRIKIFPVGEGEVLSTTEQIGKMNVVIILLDMVK